MEVPSLTALPSHASARAAAPVGFLERALAHQRRPSGSFAAGADAPHDSGFGFDDLIDIVNPLQHVPIVSTAYRSVTGDRIGPVPRLLGGALFGGLIGFALGAANAVLQHITGKDAGEHVVAALFGGPESSEPDAVMVASADPERALAAQPALPATAEGQAPTQAAQAPASAGAPRPWYVAGLRGRHGEAATPQPPAAQPTPDQGAPGAVAVANARQAPSDASRRSSQEDEEPLRHGLASIVPRLTPAQVDLLLASVGKRAPAEAFPEANLLRGAAAGSSAEARGETRPLEPFRDGAAAGSPLVAERIRRGLEAYRSAGGALGTTGRSADILR